ncbi:TIR domain-containing protein [Streptomyces sp. WAC06614]|uniref:TIR domain-containing protein n=1 Tax=Streptomyces sp. WAC06614 TaxID=2487416 RepID=UPI000F79630C|nr:TIR domain-containing protein [Streptomyces sp. WAC06614]RSS84367.1 TIR domain-containing protein [Streptomyces sp. WAC06614]
MVERGHQQAYDAFISYSHAWDKSVAKAFQGHLQGFDRPWYRPRSLRLFRDETNLGASPHLWREIEQGLAASRWLVVLACPRAAQSPWVRQEIRWWRTHRSTDTLLIAWTDGTLAWDAERTEFDWSRTDALPREEISGAFAAEPRWVDLRWLRTPEQASSANPRLLECVAEFVAPLTGRPKDELIGSHVRQHRRTVRMVQATVVLLTVLLLTAVTGGVIAYLQRNNARAQTLVAQSRQLVAQAAALRDGQPDLARQLLVQAYRLAPTPEVLGALVDSASLPRVLHLRGDGHGIAFSATGLLAVADDGVRLFDPESLTVRATLEVPDRSVRALAFSPDGALLATGDVHGEVRLFDTANAATGGSPRQLGILATSTGSHALPDSTDSLVFTPDHRLFVSTEYGGAVLDVRDPARPVVLGRLPGDLVAVAPNGRLLATREKNQLLHLWTVPGAGQQEEAGAGPTGAFPLRQVSTLAVPYDNLFSHGAFSADGQSLAFGAGQGNVRFWDVSDPAHPAVRPDLFGSAKGVAHGTVSFAPDGRSLATGAGDGVIALWDVYDPLRPRAGARLGGHSDDVSAAAYSPDGRLLATVGAYGGSRNAEDGRPSDNAVRLWPVSGAERTSAFTTLPAPASAPPTFSSDSRLLAAGHPTTLWRTDGRNTQRPLATLETFNVGGQAVAFGPDGHTLASGLPVVLWDVGDPAHPRSLTPAVTRSDGAQSIVFAPGKPLLAVQSMFGPVQLWDVGDRTKPVQRASLAGTEAMGSQTLAFSPDGTVLATLTKDGAARLWRLGEGAAPSPAGDVGPGQRVTSLAFGPHGRLLVGAVDGSVSVWETGTPRPSRRSTSTMHTGPVVGLAVHPDGSLAASAAEDGRVRLWDVSAPDRLVELTSLSGGGLLSSATVAFSPDGRLLAVSRADEVQLWSVERDAILRRLCAQSPRITPEQWVQYLPEHAYDPPCA